MAVSPDGLLWVVERDECLVFADTRGTILARTPTRSMITASMQFSADGAWLVAFHADQGSAEVALYGHNSSAPAPSFITTLPRGEDSADDGVAQTAFSKTGRVLAVQHLMSDSRQTLSLYEVATHRRLWSQRTQAPSLAAQGDEWFGVLAFSEDEATIFAGPMVPHDTTMSVTGFSVASGSEVWRRPLQDAPCSIVVACNRLWIETRAGIAVAKL